jgi:hypothetical protein
MIRARLDPRLHGPAGVRTLLGTLEGAARSQLLARYGLLWPSAVRADQASMPDRAADREARDRGKQSGRKPPRSPRDDRPNRGVPHPCRLESTLFFETQSPLIGACQDEYMRYMFTRPRFKSISVSSISHPFTGSVRQNTTIRAARQPSPDFFSIGDRSVGASSRRGRFQASTGIAPPRPSSGRLARQRLRRPAFPVKLGAPVSDSSSRHESKAASTVIMFCYNRR